VIALEHPPYFPNFKKCSERMIYTNAKDVTAKVMSNTDRGIKQWFPGMLPKLYKH
jgi:hypothetical protein